MLTYFVNIVKQLFADVYTWHLFCYFCGMVTIFLALAVLGIGFALFAIRLFFFKDAEVRGGCASKNPLLLKDGIVCTVCGKEVQENCENATT